jgi:hypothetical protein
MHKGGGGSLLQGVIGALEITDAGDKGRPEATPICAKASVQRRLGGGHE